MLPRKAGMHIVILLVISLSCSLIASGQRRRTQQTKEQISFGSETLIKRRVRIPQNVLNQLSDFEDGYLKRCQQDEYSRQQNIANHFAASALNINSDGQGDLIVQAQTQCFMGAHNTTFWIFAKVAQRLYPGYDMIFAKRADFLGILKSSTNGYRDIETASHTTLETYTTIWKFDGQNYQPRLCTIQGTTRKVVRVRCSPE
ncbi:MAG: hypothetical protein WKF74_11300 [Pyrinomonadaceae bacterium]